LPSEDERTSARSVAVVRGAPGIQEAGETYVNLDAIVQAWFFINPTLDQMEAQVVFSGGHRETYMGVTAHQLKSALDRYRRLR